MEEANFLWTVRLKENNNDETRCFVRQHEFSVGAAISFDSEYEKISALEHVLGAIASDLLGTIRRLSKKMRLEVEDIEGVIQCKLENPLVYLQVIGETGNTSIEKIIFKVYISSFSSESEIEILWKEALRISPLATTFKKSVDFECNYKLVL